MNDVEKIVSLVIALVFNVFIINLIVRKHSRNLTLLIKIADIIEDIASCSECATTKKLQNA